MTDQLTSVRFARDTIETLKLLADLNDGSVAAEIRAAVDHHIAAATSAPGFREQVEQEQRDRLARTEELTAQILAGVPKRP